LVLVEIELAQPGDGVTLIEWIRARSRVPAVLVGRAADPKVLQRAGAARADGYLVKPLAAEALLECARALLRVGPAGSCSERAAVDRPRLSSVQLGRVKAYVERTLGGPVSLDQMAEHVEMSRGHFARLFKESTGSTPYAFVMARRMARAKTLLVETAMSIGDVAAEVGYESQGHFSTLFKRATGLSPRDFRERGAQP